MPALDALERAGTSFSDASAAATWSVPSHATMLTGLLPSGHGAGGTSPRKPRPEVGFDLRALSPDVLTLAQRLRDSGRRTAGFYFGPVLDARWGFARGFDDYRAGRLDGTAGEDLRESTLGDAARWLLEEADERHFFLFVHTFVAHRYLAVDLRGEAGRRCPPRLDFAIDDLAAAGADERACGRLKARYAHAARCLDDELGALLDALARAGRDRDTLVVVTSDHGEALCERNLRAPRVGHGYPPYESQLRVPLVLRFPDGRGAGARVNAPARSADIVPTVLDALGLAVPEGLHGESLLPLVAGSTAPARPVLAETDEWQMLRADGLKYIRYRDGAEELYDLAADPREAKDLSRDAARAAAPAARLRAFYLRHGLGYRLLLRGRRGDRFAVTVESDAPAGYAAAYFTERGDRFSRRGRTVSAAFVSDGDGDEDWLAFDRSASTATLRVAIRLNGRPLDADRFRLGGRPGTLPATLAPGGEDPARVPVGVAPDGAAASLWRLDGAAPGAPSLDDRLREALRAAGYQP